MTARLCHWINGKRYVATPGEPRHETLESYRECVRLAYGSTRGVTFGTYTPKESDNG